LHIVNLPASRHTRKMNIFHMNSIGKQIVSSCTNSETFV